MTRRGDMVDTQVYTFGLTPCQNCNNEIAMIASGVVKDAGYNFATGVAEMSLTLRS
jgi:hypothetical protein